jgi:hypothetical protein
VKTLRNYPQISKWLGSWLEQLKKLGTDDDYRVILDELVSSAGAEFQEQHHQNLKRLDDHLCVASTICGHFDSLISEKRQVGSDLDEANKAILDKLAEVHAIVGLRRLGFDAIEFIGTPDFAAVLQSKRFLIEVTRLGASSGKRSDSSDKAWGSIEAGIKMDFVTSRGKAPEALLEAFYREIEDKYPQLKKADRQADGMIVWISIGQDYLPAGKYEPNNVGLFVRMPNTIRQALCDAVTQIKATGSYAGLSHVVISCGRDRSDLVLPELDRYVQSF